jgi:PAS domain S-box-containing protein
MGTGRATETTATVNRSLESAVALAIARSRGLSDAGEHALGAIGEKLGLRAGLLWRIDPLRGRMVVVASWAADPDVAPFLVESSAVEFVIGEDVPGADLASGRVLWRADVSDQAGYRRRESARRFGLRTSIAIPLVAQGQTIGVAELLASEVLEPDPDMTAVLEALGAQIGQLLQRVVADEATAISEARKAAILEAAVDVVITADLDGCILEANHALTDLLGWPVEQAIGARISDLLVPPELRERHEAGLRRYADPDHAPAGGRRIEVEALHRDGGRVPIELTVTRVDAPGQRLVTAFLRDVSERRRVDAERERLLEAEQNARASAEAAWQRLRLVSDVSELLASTFSYPEALEKLADRVVFDIADLCLIDAVDAHGRITREVARHRDRRKQPLADRLLREYAPQADGPHPAANVISTAHSRFSPYMSEEFLRATCRDQEHYELVRALGFQSYISVPLVARSRILGALTLVSTNPRRRFTEQDVAVAEEISRRAAVRIDNARLYHERDKVAHVLQRGLLPQRLPMLPRLEVAARYLPAGDGIEAGGDFYDAFAAGPKRWAVVIGDVCGKGPEAAAGMGIARPALRALARAYRKPVRLLEALNEELLQQGAADQFLTVAYVQVRIDEEPGVELTACLAGHPPVLLVGTDGEVRELGRPGTLLGVFSEIELHEHRVRMRPGELLILYTDGLADDTGSPAAMTPEQLRDFLTVHRGSSASQLTARVDEYLEAALAPTGMARDDIAFLIVRCVK